MPSRKYYSPRGVEGSIGTLTNFWPPGYHAADVLVGGNTFADDPANVVRATVAILSVAEDANDAS